MSDAVYHHDTRKAFLYGVVIPCVGELAAVPQEITGIPNYLDVNNHAGNMTFGGVVGMVAAMSVAAIVARQKDEQQMVRPTSNRLADVAVPGETLSSFRVKMTAAALGAATILNCITETKWGVQNLPVAEMFNGPTPDIYDTLYSTVWAGICANIFWRKPQHNIPPHARATTQ